jgi:DNA-binding transcriptional regulator LsrR (DeoR family)
MSNKLFMGGVMVAGTLMAVSGGMDLGSILRSAPFDYQNATQEERVAFLQDETRYIEKRVKRGVVNPSGVGWSASLRKVEHDARRNEVRFVVRFSGEMANNAKSQAAIRDFQKRMCEWRVDGRLGGTHTRLTVNFVTKQGRTRKAIVADDGVCRSLLQA